MKHGGSIIEGLGIQKRRKGKIRLKITDLGEMDLSS